MEKMSAAIDINAMNALNSIKQAINNENVIPIDADFYFTKGSPGHVSGHVLRDKQLEDEVIEWIRSRTSFETLIHRYKKYYPPLTSLDWPRHYATRFVNIDGKAAEGENIFMFFPEVLGLTSGKVEDYFGFEFIDMWASVFDEIVFPCMRRVFDQESQLKLFTSLRPNLEKTIYLASVFHEIGHRCSYWRVSPSKDPRVKINKFHTDVLGELATDTQLVNFLHEFPEVLYFVFLQRLFWFGRFGFKHNPVSGKLNEDNDTWIGAYLFNKYIQAGVLSQNSNDRWHVNFEKLNTVFAEVLRDIDTLGENVVQDEETQDLFMDEWMQKKVAFKNQIFLLPREMQEIFIRCVDVAEKPQPKY